MLYSQPVADVHGGMPRSDPKAADRTLRVPTPHRTILIVDDDEPFRRMMGVALRFAGFQTREARSGMEALAMLDRWRADLVVLDLVLPGVDGLAVREELASHPGTRTLPVVIVTGSQLNLDGVDAACILRKPFTMDELVTAVRNCLRISPG